MKKLLVSLAGAALLLAACTPQELSNQALKDRLDQHDKDIAALQGDVNELKTAVSQINSNIAALQTAVTKLEGNVYVKDVIQIKDVESNVIGYTIKFTDNTSIAIYHGEKGEQGQQGEIGPQGPQGATPTIGVKLYDGVYYWTLNDEYMTDEKGKMIPATGEKGNPGQDGNNGQTPQLRIEAGNWEVSYDGQTWTVVGPAQTAAESVDVVFKGVKETKDAVVFTLSDDSKLSIDKYVDFSLKIDDSVAIDVVEGATTNVPYTLSGVGKGDSRVDAVAGGDWWAEVEATDKESGVLKVTAGAAKQAKVIVYAVDGKGRADMRALVFNGGSLAVSNVPVEDSPIDGGSVTVDVVTNVDYVVEIEEEAQTWLSYVITKAGETRKEKLVLTVEKNYTPDTRSGLVEIKDQNGAVIQNFTVKQESGVYSEPVFTDEAFGNWILYKFDTDKDGHISAEEASKVTEITLNYDQNWNYQDYSSLAGIEVFYNLKKLTVNRSSKVTSIDLSKNKNLQDVTISKSGTSALVSLDLSDLHALKAVQLGGMTSITTVELGSAPALQSLMVWNTGLEALDVTKAPELVSLSAYGTKITTLDLSKNTKLESAIVGITTLATLTLPAEPALKVLNLNNAAVTELDLSKLTLLEEFSAEATKLETIDLSNSAKLTKLSIGNLGGSGKSTVLKKVDIRKAANLATVYLYSDALEEVFVLKGTKVASWNWSSYHQDPDTGEYTYVKVTEIEGEGGDEPAVEDFAAGIKEPFVKKIILGKFDKNGDGAIDETEAAAITELDLSECGLQDGDLAGLEVFPIEKLLLNGNKFTQFDVLAWPNLSWLNLNNNKLTALSLGKNYTDLKQNLHLEAANNQITSFTGPSYYGKLSYLDVSNNKISGALSMLNYSTVPTYVNVANNQITSISLSNCSNLAELNVSNNSLSSLGVSGLGKLKKVNASGNNLTSYSFGAAQYVLEEVDLSYTKITSIDITNIAKKPTSFALKKVDVTGNEGFNLVIVGAGNQMPEGLEIVGAEDYIVLNAANPSLPTTTYISSYTAGDNAEYGSIKINYTLSTPAFKIADGGSAYVVPQTGKKTFYFFAVATSGNPTITLSRSSGKEILTKETDQSPYGSSYICTGHNPMTPAANESAGKDWTSFIVDGNGDKVSYHFSLCGKSDGNTVADEKINFSVSGGTVVIFGVSFGSYRPDEG